MPLISGGGGGGGSTFNGGTITNGLTVHSPVDATGLNVRANAGTTFADLIQFQNQTGAFVVEIDAGDDVTIDTRDQGGTFLAHAVGGQVSVGFGGIFVTAGAAKEIVLSSGGEIQVNGTAVGFFGAAPVAQPTAIANAAGGAIIDAEARVALNALLAAARTLGLIAT